jgi:hypothetical protein
VLISSGVDGVRFVPVALIADQIGGDIGHNTDRLPDGPSRHVRECLPRFHCAGLHLAMLSLLAPAVVLLRNDRNP